MEWVINATPQPLYLQERPGTHCIEAGCAPGSVWTGVENLAPTGILSRTIQSVASRYTDWAIPPHVMCCTNSLCLSILKNIQDAELPFRERQVFRVSDKSIGPTKLLNEFWV